MLKLRSDLHSRKTPHTSPLRASYGVSFVSYTKKKYRDISRAHCCITGCHTAALQCQCSDVKWESSNHWTVSRTSCFNKEISTTGGIPSQKASGKNGKWLGHVMTSSLSPETTSINLDRQPVSMKNHFATIHHMDTIPQVTQAFHVHDEKHPGYLPQRPNGHAQVITRWANKHLEFWFVKPLKAVGVHINKS